MSEMKWSMKIRNVEDTATVAVISVCGVSRLNTLERASYPQPNMEGELRMQDRVRRRRRITGLAPLKSRITCEVSAGVCARSCS